VPDAGPAMPAAAPDEAGPGDASPGDGGAADAGAGIPARMLRLSVSGLPEDKLRLEISDQAQRPILQADSRAAGEGIRLRDVVLPADCEAIFVAVGAVSGKVPQGVYQIEAQVEPAPPGLEL